MQQLKHVQGALGWCLVGLLLTYALINVIGFASPFWGLWRYPGDPHASHGLLHFWQPVTPWFSICFVVAAWHLVKTVRATVARVGIVAMGVLVPVAHIGSSYAGLAMAQADAAATPQLSAAVVMLAEAYLGLAALAFVALAWRAVRESRGRASGA